MKRTSSMLRGRSSAAATTKKNRRAGDGRGSAKVPSTVEPESDRETVESGSEQDFDVDELDLEHHHGSEDESQAGDASDSNSDDDDDDDAMEGESAQERRIRLAKKYIASIEREAARKREDVTEFDAAELDRELIASRLREDALEASGKLHRPLADAFRFSSVDGVRSMRRPFRYSVTCVAVTPDDRFVYAGSKCGKLVKYQLVTGSVVQVSQFPKMTVQHLAISTDGRFLACAGKDLKIYGVQSEGSLQDSLLHTFKQHRDQVMSVAFRKGSNTLYSASADRTIKVFNVDDMAYVETLFGHQDVITSLDAISTRERCISTGGRDRTVRLWKLLEESQLVFRSTAKPFRPPPQQHSLYQQQPNTDQSQWTADQLLELDESGSVDVCAMLDEETWVTGSDGGALSLWSIQRKKPLIILPNAHGRTCLIPEDANASGEAMGGIYGTVLRIHLDRENAEQTYINVPEMRSNPNWITALATMPYSDIVASGSHDGFVRVWKVVLSGDNDDDVSSDGGNSSGEEEEQVEMRQRMARSRKGPCFRQIAKIPVTGFVNSLRFSTSGRYLVAGVGQEHKTGRWEKVKEARNSVVILPISFAI